MTALALAPARDLSSPITTADELAAAFLLGYGEATREAYGRDLKVWATWLREQGIGPLDAHRAHVELWMRCQDAQGAAPASIARRLASVSGFYSYAEDEGLIAGSSVRRVRRPRANDESPRLGVDRDQLRALLDAAEADGARSHALVCLLGLNGLRIGETLGADIADLGIERGHRVLALRRKGGKRGLAPLAPRTSVAIDVLTHGRDEGPIFVTRTGRRMDRHAGQKLIRRLAKAAGIPTRCSPHTHCVTVG